MSDPINPNTLLPMSLQVDKMEQVRQLHNAHEQSVLSQKQIEDDKKKNNHVNKNEKSENLQVNDDDNKNNEQGNKENKEDNKEDNDNKKQIIFKKGNYIDVKI